MNTFQKLYKDPSAYIFRTMRQNTIKCNSALVSILSRLIIRMKGIKAGKNASFYGWPLFVRSPLSSIEIGNNCTFRSKSTSNLIGINRKCMISTVNANAQIKIGNNCGFSGTVIGAFKLIQIGNNVMCGANTLITDSDWHLDDPRSGEPKSVVIEENVWLGLNVTVLKGVHIGKNSVIGANSLVVNDIPPNVIAAGNPCKIIRKLGT